MTDKELLKTVKSFRKGILGKRNPDGMCFAVSSALEGYLAACKVESNLLEVGIVVNASVWQHYVLKLPDGRILDATASQFKTPNGEKMPDIFLGERPTWYLKIRNTKHSEAPKKEKRYATR